MSNAARCRVRFTNLSQRSLQHIRRNASDPQQVSAGGIGGKLEQKTWLDRIRSDEKQTRPTAASRIELSICLIIEIWNGLANPGSHSGGYGFESRQLHHSNQSLTSKPFWSTYPPFQKF